MTAGDWVGNIMYETDRYHTYCHRDHLWLVRVVHGRAQRGTRRRSTMTKRRGAAKTG